MNYREFIEASKMDVESVDNENQIQREGDKPNPKDQHKGCMVHDEICLDEQMKAGCAVEIFICYNCRYMGERGHGHVKDLISSIFGGQWNG